MSYVICKNPGPDQKFTNPNPQSTCMCIITIKSQDRNQCVTIHAMSNFSSPDQKFSEQKETCDVMWHIDFFQPGLEIRRLTIPYHTRAVAHVHICQHTCI